MLDGRSSLMFTGRSLEPWFRGGGCPRDAPGPPILFDVSGQPPMSGNASPRSLGPGMYLSPAGPHHRVHPALARSGKATCRTPRWRSASTTAFADRRRVRRCAALVSPRLPPSGLLPAASRWEAVRKPGRPGLACGSVRKVPRVIWAKRIAPLPPRLHGGFRGHGQWITTRPTDGIVDCGRRDFLAGV